jgi:hypothetical protein
VDESHFIEAKLLLKRVTIHYEMTRTNVSEDSEDCWNQLRRDTDRYLPHLFSCMCSCTYSHDGSRRLVQINRLPRSNLKPDQQLHICLVHGVVLAHYESYQEALQIWEDGVREIVTGNCAVRQAIQKVPSMLTQYALHPCSHSMHYTCAHTHTAEHWQAGEEDE